MSGDQGDTKAARIRVVVLDDLHGAVEKYAPEPLTSDMDIVVYQQKATSVQELISHAHDANVVMTIRGRSRLTRGVLAALHRCSLISHLGGKTDHIDLEAATELGISVSYTPNCGDQAVAEYVVGSAISYFRNLGGHSAEVHLGSWRPAVGRELGGRTLGLVGFGPIAQRVSRIASAFGMEIVAWSPTLTAQRASSHMAQAVPLNECLGSADVLSVHVPGLPATDRLIGEREIAQMKSSALFINTSRGSVVDQRALTAALADGRLFGAVLDVFDKEPIQANDPILGRSNVIATPHIAWETEETYKAFVNAGFQNIVNFYRGAPSQIVNPSPTRMAR